MEIRTRVREIRGDYASLACENAGRCDLCAGGRGCGLGLLGASVDPSLEVLRSTGGGALLEPGDLVLISVADGAILRAATTTYLLPLAGLLAGAGLARGLGAVDLLQFAAAIAGALIGVWRGRRAGTYRFEAVPIAPAAPDRG